MYKKIIYIISLISLFNTTFTNCKKSNYEVNKSVQNKKPSIPGYYNINFDSIFTKKDNYSPEDDTIVYQLNKYFTHVWKSKNLSGGILVARGNTILLEKYNGYSNWEDKTLISPQISLHVASVSKILTSLAVLKLVEAHKINLDQKVNTILTDFPYSDITIHDLLTHRSGLPEYTHLVDLINTWDKRKKMSNEDVLDLFSTHTPLLQYKPNTHFSYSNSNFALLALIVEKTTNMSFPEVINTMIFTPLGMKHSYILQEKDLKKANLSYYPDGRPYKFNHLDLVYGDKNVYTTPEDLFRLSQAMFASNFLRKDLLDQMYTPYSNEIPNIKNYGLGMRLMVFKNGKKLIYHTGWWHGSNAIFIHLVDEKVTIIAIGNKYSNMIYSAIRLAPLFGDYPLPNMNKYKYD